MFRQIKVFHITNGKDGFIHRKGMWISENKGRDRGKPASFPHKGGNGRGKLYTNVEKEGKLSTNHKNRSFGRFQFSQQAAGRPLKRPPLLRSLCLRLCGRSAHTKSHQHPRTSKLAWSAAVFCCGIVQFSQQAAGRPLKRPPLLRSLCLRLCGRSAHSKPHQHPRTSKLAWSAAVFCCWLNWWKKMC